MPACVIGQRDFPDPQSDAACPDGFMPGFERHRGELPAPSTDATGMLDGELARPRAVRMRFPSVEATRARHDGPDDREMAKIGHRTARTDPAVVADLETSRGPA